MALAGAALFDGLPTDCRPFLGAVLVQDLCMQLVLEHNHESRVLPIEGALGSTPPDNTRTTKRKETTVTLAVQTLHDA